MKYYLDGIEIDQDKGFIRYNLDGLNQGIDQQELKSIWDQRDHEEFRDIIFDISGYSLEIISLD